MIYKLKTDAPLNTLESFLDLHEEPGLYPMTHLDDDFKLEKISDGFLVTYLKKCDIHRELKASILKKGSVISR